MNSQVSTDVYMQEYTRDDIIARYISDSAGDGYRVHLHHVYAPTYLRAIRELISSRPKGHKFRVMEYGCGGGMNLLRIAELLRSEGAALESGYGAGFFATDDRGRAEGSLKAPPWRIECQVDVCGGGQ